MGRAGRAARDTAAGDGIQFVAPRMELFGGVSSPTVDDPDVAFPEAFGDAHDDRPARWTTALAGLGVASLIAVGVVAAAPWDDQASPPTTTPPSTTTPTSTTEVDATAPSPSTPAEDPFAIAASGGPPVGYLLDPVTLSTGTATLVNMPSRFTVQNDHLPWLDVWATPGASSIVGDWLSVEVSPWPTGSRSAVERVQVGGQVGVVDTNSLLPRLSVPIGDRNLVLTGSGWSRDELVALAAGMDIVNGRPVYPGGTVGGHELAVSRASVGWGVLSELRAQDQSSLGWVSTDGRFLEVTTRPRDDDADRALRDLLLRPIDGQPFAGPGGRVVTAGGRTVVIGRPFDADAIEATFDERGSTVTVRLEGSHDIDVLLRYLDPAVLRAGTAGEWTDLEYGVLLDQDQAQEPWDDTEQLVASGALGDEALWTMSRTGGPVDGDPSYSITLTSLTSEGSSTDASDSEALQLPTYAYLGLGPVPTVSVDAGGALAVVVVDASTGAQTLVASAADGPLASTALVPVPDDADGVPAGSHLLVGILPFDVLGPWSVQLVAADGRQLGSTDSAGISTAA